MKKAIYLIILLPLILGGCISRTISKEAPINDQDEVSITNKEIIWFWQSEFWNSGN
jgi:PBP1b-binding outer membrane lipoprotein LpoB